ncbi:hypothetical protein JXA47_17025 [Candidatus Sumerlaeota bacterium]|nr:hypothetical protein [Candidatus Sumerlaeota bacterium]
MGFESPFERTSPVALLIGLAAGLLLNACEFWLVVNYLLDLGERIPFKKCLLCACGLAVWGLIAVAAIYFLPFAFLILFIVWILGAKVVIESAFEITEGGFIILILYILTSIGVSALLPGRG